MNAAEMTSLDIVEAIGRAAAVEQCAEEAAELAAACSKFARKMRLQNPTPAGKREVIANVQNEAADVATCLGVLIDAGIIDQGSIKRIADAKLARWKQGIAGSFNGGER